MVKFLVLQIKMGKITIENVPEKYREAVASELGVTLQSENSEPTTEET